MIRSTGLSCSRLYRLSRSPHPSGSFSPSYGFSSQKFPIQSLVKNRQDIHVTPQTLSSATQTEDPLQTSSTTLSESELNLVNKLRKSFPGGQIIVQDVSGGCGQFFAIQVIHSDFSGLSTIKQHRLVNKALADDIKTIHGLQVDYQTAYQ
ncbi:hypothetical protein CROQUDRAFT_51591 [Cronartium quercuum f. sp. fusiforme G11]|uniref:Bola-like protein n=1 Tax=Cronartium quercuum f. sp. fusiforme G11 TaxID=708437 RepID=A0A9P6T731_9BASI|nr:hypothetical protein CROQUDRAFT_51591 [Cronartium quercuum f. sp. fusiforme G11]